ncbi:hypothetical protein M404DRAFT_35348 [Pisolithus tinctorius Marx 270]|uniref:Uncharacterized protein n=1 Tax=Pisolithus tinctorius Marx 270 TaxID=870435 RepID=A0A0C3J8W5_PISTI|nr:hypothetical protein M404DRAFT_35348 [Pisolithus tinctorius Marx 270]
MQACIDMCLAFGSSPSAGMYGRLVDMEVEIFRSQEYNTSRQQWNMQIALAGLQYSGSRVFFKGITHEDGSFEEFNKDC